MPRLTPSTLSRLVPRATAPRPATQSFLQRYATSNQQPGQSVDGASGKDTKKAQPKILSESPPKEGEASAEVNEHNQDMNNRAEKAAERVKDEDVEKDKVGKGFWSGDKSGGPS